MFKLERYEEANIELTEVLRLNPNNVDARVMKAFCYYNIGLKLDALSEINRALNVKKEDSSLHELKGKIYFETGFYKLALSEFKIAAHYDPNNPDHYYNAAACYYNLKMYNDALTYMDLALSKGEKANYHILKALILKELNMEFSQEIEEAIKLDPSTKSIIENLFKK